MADRKISDLTELAAADFASGDYLPIVDISEAAAVDRNKRVLISNIGRGSADGAAGAPAFSFVADQDTGAWRPADNTFAFSTGGSQAVTIDSSQRVLIGSSTSYAAGSPATPISQLQNHGTTYATSAASLFHWQDIDDNAAFFSTNKSRGAAVGTHTIVQDDDRLGGISCGGSDGTSFIQAARIDCRVDGTPASGTVPGRLTFLTTASGDGAPTERVRITNDGKVGINTVSPTELLDVDGKALFGRIEIGSNNVGTTTDIEMSASGVIRSVDSIRNVVNDFGHHSWWVGGSDAGAGVGGATEMMRLDDSGNLGLGTTLPEKRLDVVETEVNIAPNATCPLVVRRDANVGINLLCGNTADGGIFFGDTDNAQTGRIIYDHSVNALDFYTGSTKALSIDSDHILHTLSAIGATFYANVNTDFRTKTTSSTDAGGIAIESTSDNTGNRFHISFSNPNGVVGSIRTNGSATAYLTSSDYRLKENITPVADGIDRLKQLKPSRFNFIADPSVTVDGFLAHEVQDVIPEAISGEKDAVQTWEEGENLPDGVSVGDTKLDENGDPIPSYQGIDQSKLVPPLTAALQEAVAKIETLEARLNAAGL